MLLNMQGLKTLPKIFPSYAKLEEKYKKWLLEGLGAQFNFAQLVQGSLSSINIL